MTEMNFTANQVKILELATRIYAGGLANPNRTITAYDAVQHVIALMNEVKAAVVS